MNADSTKRPLLAALVGIGVTMGLVHAAAAQRDDNGLNPAAAELSFQTLEGPKSSADAKEKLDRFQEDPLRVSPRELSTPQHLPDDTSPPDCSAPVALGRPLSLVDVVDLALCTNPQVKATWAGVKAGAASLGEAKAAYLPTLTAGLSRVQDRTSFPGSGMGGQSLQDTSRNLGLNWRLFDFGTRSANQAAANALLDAALATHDATLQRLLESVVGAYFDAQSARASWDSKTQLEQLAQRTLDTARRREASGAGSQTDTLQASTALAKATLERSRAAGDWNKALAVLVYALGLPAGTPIQLAADLNDDSTGVERELAEWLTQAQIQHPAIRAARAQLEAARQRVASVRAEGLPTVDLGVNQYRNGRPNQGLPPLQSSERVIAVTLSIPIFEGFARTYKMRGAEAQAEQKSAELADIENQILMNVVKAHADAVAALANLGASEDLHNAATMATESVRRKLDKGATDMIEMLTVQAALTDAEQQRIRSLADWRSARLRLFAAAGRLGHLQLAK
jgi:outer membrane protein